jgi:hypothetical protein
MRCDWCGADFLPKTPHGRFCTAACRSRGWQQQRRLRLDKIERCLRQATEELALLRTDRLGASTTED